MTTLQFADTHNLVAFLVKPTKSEGFEQIVDFLNAHTIKYALIVNPMIYTSCIEQLWATVKVKTINREVQLQVLVDGKKIIVTEASVRRDLQLNNEEGTNYLPNATIFEELTRMGMVKNLDNAGKFLMYPRFVQVFLDKQLEVMSSHKRIYVTPSHTKKIFGNMKRVGKGFSQMETPLFPTMMVQAQQEQGKGSEMPIDPHHTPTIIQPSTSQPQLKQRSRKPKRKDTEIPQSSGPTNNIADEAGNEEWMTVCSGGGPRGQETMGDTIAQTRSENVSKLSYDPLLARGNTLRNGEDRLKLYELMELCTNLQNRVIDLENTKTAQAQEITSLKLRVKKLEKKGGSRTHKLKRLYKVGRSTRIVSSDEASLGDQEDASKQGRKINDIDKDAEITLVDETQGRYSDDIMFDISDHASEEVFVAEQGVSNSNKYDATQVNTAATIVSTASTIPFSAASITDVEITLAQALAELKSAKPTIATSTRSRAKGLIIHEQEKATTPTVSSQQLS
ncbi:hypothetical protein Tco_1190257 [Tanacetum coccineum]